MGADTYEKIFIQSLNSNLQILPGGENLVKLTNVLADESFPRFAPDGSKVVYSSKTDADPKKHLKLRSTPPSLLAQPALPQGNYNDIMASWCPDGRIVFVSDRDGNKEIYIINGDGTNIVRLTNNTHEDTYPFCAPTSLHVNP